MADESGGNNMGGVTGHMCGEVIKGEAGESAPTERAIARVLAEVPHFDRAKALGYIAAAHRGNLICLACGSENHTEGSDWCNHPRQFGRTAPPPSP